MSISTDMATHILTTINAETAPFVWDPQYNNQQTEYSNKDLFTYGEDYVNWLAAASPLILREQMEISGMSRSILDFGPVGNMGPFKAAMS